MNIYDPSSNPPNMVDTKKVMNYIYEVLNYINNTDIGKKLYEKSKLNEEKKNQYEKHMEKKFKDFSESYYSTFKVTIHKQDISIILGMLDSIEKVKNGHIDFDQAEKNITEKLMDKYNVYDVLTKKKSKK